MKALIHGSPRRRSRGILGGRRRHYRQGRGTTTPGKRVQRLARNRDERMCAQVYWVGSVMSPLVARRSNSASSMISMPSARAFSNLLPAFSSTTCERTFSSTHCASLDLAAVGLHERLGLLAGLGGERSCDHHHLPGKGRPRESMERGSCIVNPRPPGALDQAAGPPAFSNHETSDSAMTSPIPGAPLRFVLARQTGAHPSRGSRARARAPRSRRHYRYPARSRRRDSG